MTISRMLLAFTLVTAVSLGALPASAANWQPFSAAAFAQAKKDGKPILVDITAPWCPVCKAQKPILHELTQDSKFKDMLVFEVDFDTQKDAVRALNAQSQSTLIAYRGDKETARSAGDTSLPSIEILMKSAL
jgi:thiol-disulfide isomerase/thioredoxin